jgi:hypothetical protein
MFPGPSAAGNETAASSLPEGPRPYLLNPLQPWPRRPTAEACASAAATVTRRYVEHRPEEHGVSQFAPNGSTCGQLYHVAKLGTKGDNWAF